jgi:hydroxymethylpyrimidine/phosphomethylpyrimidine kinase
MAGPQPVVASSVCLQRNRDDAARHGCMLASAIAAGPAAQEPLLDACSYEKRYVTERFHKTSCS